MEHTPTIAEVNAKLDRILALIQPLPPSQPFNIKSFAARVGVSRWTISKRIKEGRILTKGGRIPPTELKKFGM